VWFADHNTPKHLTMTKVSKKAVELVGLSYSLQSHRKENKASYRNYITVSQNQYTNEIKIQPKSISLLTQYKQDHDRFKRNGKLYIDGLSLKARHKIQKASRVLENVWRFEKGLKSHCAFITLTYGKDFPTDHNSKKHLDSFLKRLRRLHPNCKYVWVAEKQKRGAIHFHILTPYYTPKDWVNSAWNEIVNTWQRDNNLNHQTLLPNVISVLSAGSYLAKYLSKEGQNIGGNGYGIDQKTRSLMVDDVVNFVGTDFEPEYINEITKSMSDDFGSKIDVKKFEWKSKYTQYKGYWLSNINSFQFGEWLKYKRHDFNLNLDHEETIRRKKLLKQLINEES